MPQQALHYFGVVVVLAPQGRIGVAQCMPSLNFDPSFRGNWLAVCCMIRLIQYGCLPLIFVLVAGQFCFANDDRTTTSDVFL